ncbi:MAG: carboxypeptidase M32, partial [Deltaproteobacteria bacterium]|nr:carboxypeptidase M32 [Deltaproteobacteria bacterium]
MSNETYERFISRVKEVKTLSSIGAVLHWDQETQMPAKGSEGRSEQLALVSGLAHDRLVSDDVGELLDRLGKDDSLSELERVNVREVRRAFDRERKLPTELVQELAKTQSLAHVAWAGAKKNNDYAAFAPVLEKIIALRKKAAGLINGLGDKATGDGLYDTLLDEFEPGAKTAEIRPLFESLRKDLVPLVAKIASSSTKAEAIAGHYPASKQREFGVLVTKAMGFDYDAGRLDVSAHPFCTTFNTHDVRLTTRYDEKDFRVALFGSMHEAGHGLYEQGMDYAHNATPLAEAASMGIHESQSRLWENMVGRSRAFWTTYYPKLQKTFPETLSSVPFEKFFLSVNVVKPSLIRVEADEVTYNLHILLRFELEQAIMNDEVSVSALPALWNRKMEDYLGVKPPNDAQGVLQDIHWSMGAFGYFPTYTLG